MALGNIVQENKKYEAAIKMYQEAYQIFRSAPQYVSVYAFCNLMASMSDAYISMSQPLDALIYAKKCYKIAKWANINQNLAEAYATLGKCYNKLGLYDSAQMMMDSALYKGYIAGLLDLIENVTKAKSDLYAVQGNSRDALLWYKKYAAVKDSNYSLQNVNSINELEKKYKTRVQQQQIMLLNQARVLSEKKQLEDKQSIINLNLEKQLQIEQSNARDIAKENKISLLNNEKDLKQAALKRQKLITGSVALVVLLLIVIVFFGYRNNQKIARLNSSLNNQKQDLLRLNDLKDKLFSIISHDLRSPLSNMDAMLAELADENMTQADFIALSGDLSDALQQNIILMDNLLQWAASQMAGIALRKKEIDVAELLQENIYTIKSLSERKGIQLIEDIPEELHVNADISTIRIVLRNLLSNALKFTGPGGRIYIYANF
jgi:signal transduction histidine kinase